MMRADEVPEGLVEQAERTLAFGICDDNRLDGKCDCPTDEQIRVIIAAVLPEIQAQALRDAANDILRAQNTGGIGSPANWLFHRATRLTTHTTDQIRKEHHL